MLAVAMWLAGSYVWAVGLALTEIAFLVCVLRNGRS